MTGFRVANVPKVELCEYCHEKVDPAHDRFVVIHDPKQPEPRKVAHAECYQRHEELSSR